MNLMSASVGRRLIDASYLHSDPANFLKFARKNRRLNPPDEIIDKLNSLKREAQAKERVFYSDFDVKDADEFSRTYLTYEAKGKTAEELTLQQKILLSLNQTNVRDALTTMVGDEVAEAMQSFTNREEFKETIGKIAIDYTLPIAEQIAAIIAAPKSRDLAQLLEIGKTNRKAPSKAYISRWERTINDLYTNNRSKRIEAALEAFKKNWEKVTDKEPIPDGLVDKLRSNLNLANRDIFSAKSSATGVLLEAAFIFDLDFIEGLIQAGGQMEGVSGGKTDVTFIGKYTKNRYKIQLKNSFSNTNYYSMKMSNKINFETFLAQMEEAFVLEDKLEFIYMFINTEYLKSNGLHKGESAALSGAVLTDMYAYISQLLSYAIMFYTGNTFLEDTRTNLDKGNLFFIFRGERLIPLSFFIEATIQFLDTFTRSTGQGGFRTSFGKNTSSTVQDLVKTESSLNPGTLYIRKRIALMSELRSEDRDKYRYPTNLVAVGSDAGKQIIGNAKINSTYFDLSIKQLNRYLSRIS